MQRGSNNELRNMRGRAGSPQRLLPHATIVSANGASEPIQLSEQQLNTALPHVQRSRVPRSREPTAGCVHPFVCMLCVVCYVSFVFCMLFVVVIMRVPVSCALCVRAGLHVALCVCVYVYVVCALSTCVVHVASALSRVSYMSENAPMTYRTKR